MRGLPAVLSAALITCAAAGHAPRAAASDTATATIAAHARFASRTSLRVSAQTLHFDVTDPGAPATLRVDFVAGARTRPGGEVVLTIEPLRVIEGPGGAADVGASVEFSGETEGTLAGIISTTGAVVAGRWVGSGRHAGSLRFSLRSGVAGTYSLPVRFVLTAP
jgi:hypothetical protein